MKQFQLLVLAFLLSISFGLYNQSYSQTIYFCEGVDDDGEPIDESSTFTIPEDGGYLYVLVQLPYEVGCRKVTLEIYRNGTYDNTLTIDSERNWTWFYKQITFYKSGEFTVDVYDCNDDLIVSGSVDIDKD